MSMMQIVERRVAALRVLRDSGAFVNVSVPLLNGGTLPAELFATLIFNDLDYLASVAASGGAGGNSEWPRLTRDIERLHHATRSHESAALTP